MARAPTHGKSTLDARFSFADTAFPGGIEGWHSQLRFATGIADGEHYLLRLFRRTGTALDEDLKRLITGGLRRVRRVLSSRRARHLLVEVLEIVEDKDEIGILMVDPGSPICGSSHRVRARESRLLTTTGRKVFWRNIVRVAEGLALCHDAGIVHGAISEHAIFSHSDDREDFRLGGYEACVHIADGDVGGAGHLLRSSGTVSFRQDWSDLGRAASRILGLTEDGGGPSLLSIERRMLNRLANPPHYQLFDGNIVLSELAEVVADLDRSGSSAEGELVLYPSPQVTQSDLPALTSGTVQADDRDAVLRFVEEDLSGPTVRTVVVDQAFVRVVTDLAAYGVKVVDDCLGMIENANKRRPDDYIYDAVEVPHRLHLARTRKSAEERVRKLGPGAKLWIDASGDSRAVHQADDIPTWYALILLEAFTWLREQFRIYPVEVLHPPSDGDADLAWIASREDDERDIRRKTMGLRPAYDALSRELKYDDGKPNWTLSRLDALAGDRERLPELSYEGTGGIVDGRLAFIFATSEAVVPGQTLYLRPRRDSGFERAIRRRLQYIVAARTNIELLRAIDDPAQVALDDVLRDIAAPGAMPPDDMDASKKVAWDSIVSGKSINVVVGPPGVGKTFLISHLVKSILEETPDARLLVSAQNHETLIQMEDELKKTLAGGTAIVVRVERTRSTDEVSSLRASSVSLLQSVSAAGHAVEGTMVNQRYQIKQALQPVDASEATVAERVFRDTDNLLLRSSDVTLATTSSHIIEEMIADGDQFDWVIVEEAARANGAELIGALLLGNRRIMVGDHNQLSPFDSAQRQKVYDAERASELLRGAKEQLETISDLPPEVNEALDTVKSNELLLKEVLATAARLEEPFRSIAEREVQREKDTGRPSAIVNTLLEQSRMHPAIGDLVSNTFYDKKLVPSNRVKRRKLTVMSTVPYLASPIVLLDFPPLSMAKRPYFEKKVKRSYRNELEAQALIAALKGLRPLVGADGRRPTLVILSPYLAQVNWFKHLLNQQVKKDKTLFGFASPRGNGEFVFTSDSFQGGEADVVAASLTRNNVMVGSRALGFVKNPQRMNVLLSRAKQKLVLATSHRFIREVVEGTDPDGKKDELEFLRKMLKELAALAGKDYELVGKEASTVKVKGASIITIDENGEVSGVKIYLPAWHYRARAIVQRTWGWSPIEEMILLALDRAPGTIEDVATSLGIPIQVAGSTIARLMQFGLVEVRLSPVPQLATSSVGHDFIRLGGALPERTEDREIHISLVLEKVGHSVFRNRDVETAPLYRLTHADHKVNFPPGPDETDDTMAARVTQLVAGMLRPGEWLRGVQTINSVLERKYLAIELNDVKNGLLPEGASQDLIGALQATIRTGILPEASDPQPSRSLTIDTMIAAEQLIVGGDQHLECFERIVGQAEEDVFVLSTFVAPHDEKYTERHERVRIALEQACQRGVRCHLFYGTALDAERKNAIAMQELNVRLSSVRRARGFVFTQRDSVRSHVKCLAADDGHGGAVVVLGSSNWLSSPFSALEASVELTENRAAAAGLDLLRSIVSPLSSASRSIETLQFIASDLRRTRSALSPSADVGGGIPVRMSILQADDHERLLRKVAHEADERFVCCTNKVGATMVPGLFNPAEIAGRRLADVRVYYSRQTGPIKRRHVRAHRERLHGVVDLIAVEDPQVHAKFLLWDRNHVVVSTMNWGSQSGSPDNPLDEIGLHLEGPGLATSLLAKFEAQIDD